MEDIAVGSTHIPIATAASELHTTQLRILMLIKRNVMAGCQVEGEWYVEKSSLARFCSYDADDSERKNCPSSCHGCSGK